MSFIKNPGQIIIPGFSMNRTVQGAGKNAGFLGFQATQVWGADFTFSCPAKEKDGNPETQEGNQGKG
jgi:hypothetical protein